jgi:hypothetical protein
MVPDRTVSNMSGREPACGRLRRDDVVVTVSSAPATADPSAASAADARLVTGRPLAVVATTALPLSGGITGFHLVSAAFLPILTIWHWRRSSQVVVLLLLLYLVAQLLSDSANATPLSSTLGEVRLLSTFALPALAVPWLVNADLARWQRLTVLSMASLAVLGVLYVGAPDARTVWKFALGAPVLFSLTVVLGQLWSRGHRLVAPAAVALLAAVSLYLGFRSLAAETLLAAAVLLGLVFWRPTRRVLAGLFALAIPAMFVIQSGYVWAAGSGFLGEVEQARYQRQATIDGGFLVASRPEAEISRMIIRDHPLLGLGSEPRLDDTEMVEAKERLSHRKIWLSSYIRERVLGEFQAHSMFLTAWVRAGLLGALSVVGLWLWVVVRSVRLVLDGILDGRFLPFVVCAIPILTWEFLFSPTSTGAGLIYGLLLAVILIHDPPLHGHTPDDS